MNSVLLVTGIASLMMSVFFFVLPGLDRARIRDTRQTVPSGMQISSKVRNAH